MKPACLGHTAFPLLLLFFLLQLPLGLVTITPARADSATQAEMRSVCRAWLKHRVAAQGSWSGSPAPEIAGEQPITRGDELLGLAFQIAPRGIVMVPARKELCPVFFFCETATLDFNADTVAAPVLRGRLTLATDVVAGKAGNSDPGSGTRGAAASEMNRSRWTWLTASRQEWTKEFVAPAVGVGPLLSTAWHQGPPFNLLCPIGRNGVRCVAGCGPIAAAQIVRYHAYPSAGGVGEESYSWAGDDCGSPASGGAQLQADFRNAYRWDQMPDACLGSCGGEADSAAAELCYELGVGARADYGTNCGTSAWPELLAGALQEHFGYSDSTEVVRRFESPDAHAWFCLLRDEINDLHPVLYSFVYLSGDGHAMVCDGWSIDAGIEYISLNLGGGGITGWYAVDDNGMSDPMQDSAILHLAPPDRIVTVGPNGEGDYPNVQAAIDAERDGTVIELLDGIYSGPGNRDLNTLGKQIIVRSRNDRPDECVIDCSGTASDPHRAFVFNHGETSTTMIRGLTLRNGYVSSVGQTTPALGGAVSCEGPASPRIINCVLSLNRSDQGGAIGCSGAAAPRLETCVFWRNTAREGGAFSKTGPGDVQIDGSTFQGNSAPGGGGLYVGSLGAVSLARSIVAGNTVGAAVSLTGGGAIHLSCCDLFGNDGGDWTDAIADQAGQDGNLSVDPQFCDAETGDLGLDVYSPCATPDCGLMGARPRRCGQYIHYVGAAPQYPYHTIWDAIDASQEGDRIVLVDSLYTGYGNRDLYVQCSGLTIESYTGDPAACVLDLQGSATASHRGLVASRRSNLTIRGLTIRHGWAPGGSAIGLDTSDRVRILDCVFQECTSIGSGMGRGGAVYVLTGSGSRGRTTIANCRFESCTANKDGGAIYVDSYGVSDTISVDGCTFSSNTARLSGGAVAGVGSALLKVTGSVFRANSAPSGGAVLLDGGSRGWLNSCTLFGNAASLKGGCAFVNGSGTESHFTNCIIASNSGRPPIECLGSNVFATCCDFWQNSDSTWTDCVAGVPSPENRNIFLDPQFCAPQAGDFRLSAGSPCASSQPGNQGCGRIGALSAGCPSPPISGADGIPDSGPSFRRWVPNPFREETRIDYAVPASAAGRSIDISIYDVRGRLVRTLLRGAGHAGRSSAAWNARDDAGRRVGSGVFFCRLRIGTEETIRRVIVLR